MRSERRDYRGVLHPVGVVVVGFGLTQVAAGLLSLLWSVGEGLDVWLTRGLGALGTSACITLALGASMLMYGRRFQVNALRRHEATMVVVLIWLMTSFTGSIPFILGAGMGPVDALFESASGLTTTGATVVDQIEMTLSRPLLLWRSLIQWLGGMGIVVLFVAIFPSLGAGGKLMFRGEVPGTTAEGLRPRIAKTSFTLWRLYAAFTLAELVLLWLLGLNSFEALCHALTTMSTGGFSTRNASVGAFGSAPVEYCIGGFMLLASVNYGLFYAAAMNRSIRVFIRSPEFTVFIAVVCISTFALFVGKLSLGTESAEVAFRHAFFTVATFISSTGYGTEDYMAYPSAALAVILLLMLIGGCSGSTAGGLKVERLVLLGKLSWMQIKRTLRPQVVHVVRMGRSRIDASVLSDVAAFLMIFLIALIFCTIGVVLIEGISLAKAFGATLSCLSNMGPAPFYESVDTFASYRPLSKLAFVIAMIAGRLEYFTVLVLFVPDFWRR